MDSPLKMVISTWVVFWTCISIFLVFLTSNLIRGFTNPLRNVPGPWDTRFTNLRLKMAVITGRRIYFVQSMHDIYGPYVRIAPSEVSVADVKAFTQIHRINSGFQKTKWYEELTFLPRLGIFAMRDPKDHAVRRKLFARAFSKTYLRQSCEGIIRDIVSLAVTRLRQEAEKGSVDILKWWTLMATDVSGKLMFGESWNMVQTGEVTDYIRTLQIALKGGGVGAELPWIRAVLCRIPIQIFQDLFNANNLLLSKGLVAVKNARNKSQNRNLFSTVIDEADAGGALDDLDVQVEATGLTVAGSDTTAVTLTYLVWAVLSHPHIHSQLTNEVDRLEPNFSDADLENLPLLNAVIEETLRLYGAAPGGLPRSVPREGITIGGYYMPQGTTVTTQAYTFHRDSHLWPDPDTFDPSRWLPGYKLSDDAKATYNPFGAGSRTCLGIHLARMELRLATAMFFRECRDARLATSTTDQSMEMENFFLVAPVGHRCEITLSHLH